MSEGSQLIPFTYSLYNSTPISVFEFYGDYVFAGVSNSGKVIRSKNRYSWENFYQTDDLNVSALKVFDGHLYIGTSPEGNILRINLSTLSVENFGSFGSEIVDFVVFNENLYVAVNGSPTILKLNPLTDQFDFVYSPYAPVNQMSVIGVKIYLVVENSNIITFNGINWNKVLLNNVETNISSFKHISSSMSDMFPINYSRGIKCISSDGTSVVVGASNHARVYRLLDDKLSMIFDTEGTIADNLLNIGVGVNIFSTANKAYLLHSGELFASNSISTTTTTTTEAIDINANKNVVVTYPNGEEIFQLGDTVNIQWSSTKGINDAVQIDLIQDDKATLTINARTSNNGLYAWEIPLSIASSDTCKIRVTWLAAGTSDPNNIDESDGTFSIVEEIVTTTSTTTTAPNPQQPNVSSNRGIPILVLPEHETITNITSDIGSESVLFATSTGRILSCNLLTINGFLTGDRMVYADVFDGCGYSGSSQTVFTYALYKRLAEIDENKEILKWKYAENITAIKTEKITAVFQGPIVNIRNDFGFWKELLWEEIKPSDSNITVFLRTSENENDILQKPWMYSTSSEEGEIGVITRSLNNVGLKGKYIQIKIEMETSVQNIVPSVTSITLNYSSKDAVYFFTNKFTINLEDPVKKGLLTATIDQPINTEIHFGVASENTADWNDYQVITPNTMFDLDNEELKIGIKFVSYDDSVPEVSEFAIMVGGETLEELNS